MALQLKSLSEDDLAHYWRLYVDKLAALLAEADARPHGPAPDLARRVQSLQREALFLHIRQDTLRCISNMAHQGAGQPPHLSEHYQAGIICFVGDAGGKQKHVPGAHSCMRDTYSCLSKQAHLHQVGVILASCKCVHAGRPSPTCAA